MPRHFKLTPEQAIKRRAKQATRMRVYRKKVSKIAGRPVKKEINSQHCTDVAWFSKSVTEARVEARRIEKLRTRFCCDIKFVYYKAIAREGQKTGTFHDLLFDFENLDILSQVTTYSSLPKYVVRDSAGRLKERWLYWKTLEDEPQVQIGTDGPISRMFYKGFWQGVVVKLAGTGKVKCILAPRFTLKSTVCGATGTLFRMIREPGSEQKLRCIGSDLAKIILGQVKGGFERPGVFQDCFCDLGPSQTWNEEEIRLKVHHQPAGPAVEAKGMLSDSTGKHGSGYRTDDIIAESNSTNPAQIAKANRLVQGMQAQRSPQSFLTNQGTRWAEDDPHEMFVGKPGTHPNSGILSHDASFLVATILDGDESVRVKMLENGLQITPLGYGKSIWPEVMPIEEIESKRRGMPDDRLWFSQFFNQWAGTSARPFRREWVRYYPKAMQRAADGTFQSAPTPMQMAVKLKLNIFIGFDTASGKPNQAGKLDRTAGVVLGQTQDRRAFYVLDGFCEKLPAEQIDIAILDKCEKWHAVAREYGGHFKAAFEDIAYTNFLDKLLREQQKVRGSDAFFSVERVAAGQEAKFKRVGLLSRPYCDGRIYWPEALMVESTRVSDAQMAHGVEQKPPYDFIALLMAEFVGFHPHATADDTIDAHARAFEIAYPMRWEAKKPAPQKVVHPGQYSRDLVLESDEDGGVVLDYLPSE